MPIAGVDYLSGVGTVAGVGLKACTLTLQVLTMYGPRGSGALYSRYRGGLRLVDLGLWGLGLCGLRCRPSGVSDLRFRVLGFQGSVLGICTHIYVCIHIYIYIYIHMYIYIYIYTHI